MENFLEEFLCNYEHDISNIKSVQKSTPQSEFYRKRLKATLNKNQRKLLLRITDESHLLMDKAHEESFVEGFRLGLKLGYEVHRK